LRRIEAVTGMYAYNYLIEKEKILSDISSKMEVVENELTGTLDNIKQDMQKKEQELVLLKLKIAKDQILSKSDYNSYGSNLKIFDFNFSKSELVSNMDIKSMGIVGDEIKHNFKKKNIFIVFGNIINNKPVMILQATEGLVKKGIDCGEIAGEVSRKLKGSGGGKPGFAQLGGSDAGSLGSAIDFTKKIVLKITSSKK